MRELCDVHRNPWKLWMCVRRYSARILVHTCVDYTNVVDIYFYEWWSYLESTFWNWCRCIGTMPLKSMFFIDHCLNNVQKFHTVRSFLQHRLCLTEGFAVDFDCKMIAWTKPLIMHFPHARTRSRLIGTCFCVTDNVFTCRNPTKTCCSPSITIAMLCDL